MYSELKSKQVKCRKPHRCMWCDEMIETGETAHYRAYTFDGDFHSEHMHPECFDAMGDYSSQQMTLDIYGHYIPNDSTRRGVDVLDKRKREEG